MNKLQFMNNLTYCALASYNWAFSLAKENAFANNTALDSFNSEVCLKYVKAKRLKKKFQILVFAAIIIYNNEMIVNSNLAYDLHILKTILENKMYKPHKFIQFVNKKLYYRCGISGMSREHFNKIIDNILLGV